MAKNPSAGSVLLFGEAPQKKSSKKLKTKENKSKVEATDAAHSKSQHSLEKLFDEQKSRKSTETAGELEYNMCHDKRGCFMIFSQENFVVSRNGRTLSQRKGTRRDALNIHEAVTKLGFEFVMIFHDLTKREILKWLDIVSKIDHDDYDCFGCAILTHGAKNEILYAKDAPMKMEEFSLPFTAKNCPSLAGKPKLFFIQSCRGDKYDEGTELPTDMYVTDGPFQEEKERPLTIPNAADFLLAYSTVPGYVAWLNSAYGSWFVQCLCHCINTYGEHLEIMQILTRMNYMVAYQFESNTKDGKDHYKQMPSVTTRLTADLYFTRKDEQPFGFPYDSQDQGFTPSDDIEDDLHSESNGESSHEPGTSPESET